MTRKTREAVILLASILILSVLVAYVGTVNAQDFILNN